MSENSIGLPTFHYYGLFGGWKRKMEQEVKETGVKISADITDCLCTSIRVGGDKYRDGTTLRKLVCSYAIDGRTYVFQSGMLLSDPTPYLMPDKKVIVYYDRNNMRRHFVDVKTSVAENYNHYIKHLVDSGMTRVEPTDPPPFVLKLLKMFVLFPVGLFIAFSLFFDISNPILLWFGAVIIYFGIGGFRDQKKKYAHYTESTIGTVADNRGEFTTGENGVYTYYYPIVTFEVGGQVIKAECNKRREKPLEENKQVPILYNKANPYDYYLFNGGEFPHKRLASDNGKWYDMSFSAGGEVSPKNILLIFGGIGVFLCFLALL